jgi:hypothetical protein
MATTIKKRPYKNERHPHMDGGDAFIPDVARSHERLIDDDAEAFAEEFMVTATSAEDIAEDARDEVADDELAAFDIMPADDEELADLYLIERELRAVERRA